MAVTILQPKSVYADLEDDTTYILKWTNDINGQYAYEIMYKLKKATDWSTLGINNSTNTSFDLREIYNVTGLDIHEIYYRVMVYFKNGELEGKECSSTFSIIFKNKITSYLGTYDGNSISHYPAFDKINSMDIEVMGVGINDNIKNLPLVDEDSPLNSNLKVKTPKKIKSVASNYAKFKPSNIYGRGEFNKYVKQEYQYVDYVYRNDMYYYSNLYNYTRQISGTYNYQYSSSYSSANYSVGSSPYTTSISYNYAGYSSRTYYYYYTSSYARTAYAYDKTYFYYYRESYSYLRSYVRSTYYGSYLVGYFYKRFYGSGFLPFYYISNRYLRTYYYSYRTYYYTNYKWTYFYYYRPSYSYTYKYTSGYRYYRYSYTGYAYRYYRAYGYYYYISSYSYAYKYTTAYKYYNYISSYSYFYKYAYGYKPYTYGINDYAYKYLTAYRNNSYEIPVYRDNSYFYRYYTTNKQEVS